MIETIKAKLNIFRCLNMKPNYSDLARKYGVSRQTISKYYIRCLIEAFKYYGGVPKRLLTDNMSSIVVESANRFISRLVPYNYEFENEEELIAIINRLSVKIIFANLLKIILTLAINKENESEIKRTHIKK